MKILQPSPSEVVVYVRAGETVTRYWTRGEDEYAYVLTDQIAAYTILAWELEDQHG